MISGSEIILRVLVGAAVLCLFVAWGGWLVLRALDDLGIRLREWRRRRSRRLR